MKLKVHFQEAGKFIYDTKAKEKHAAKNGSRKEKLGKLMKHIRTTPFENALENCKCTFKKLVWFCPSPVIGKGAVF